MVALFRLAEIDQAAGGGRDKSGIFIDGLHIASQVPLPLRERLAIIPQDPILFMAPFASNQTLRTRCRHLGSIRHGEHDRDSQGSAGGWQLR